MKKAWFLICIVFFSILSYASPVDLDKDSTLVKVYAADNGYGLWGYYSPKDSVWVVPPCVHTMELDSVFLKKGKTDYYFLGEVNGKRCVVNIKGDFIVPPVYDEVTAVNYDEGLDYTSYDDESKEIYKRSFASTNIGCCRVFQIDTDRKRVTSSKNTPFDLYDINHASKICSTQREFLNIFYAKLIDEDGVVMFCGTYRNAKQEVEFVHGLMDCNGRVLYSSAGRSNQLDRIVVGCTPVYHFSDFGKSLETVDFYGNRLAVKYEKNGNLNMESANKVLVKLAKKGTDWTVRGDSLKQVFHQYVARREQPKALANYLDMMEERYDRCERLNGYGDNVILRYDGRYGMDYRGLGLALYCEYDTIAPIAGHEGLYAVKRAGKWGVANETGLTAKCCYDHIRVDDDGDVVLSVESPIFDLYNCFTKQKANYEETIDSAGYPAYSNLRTLLTSNKVKPNKDDVRENFFALTELGKYLHRSDIVALTYLFWSHMESLRKHKQSARGYKYLAEKNTSSFEVVDSICDEWWNPVSKAYWDNIAARRQRFIQKLERINHVLDKTLAVIQPLAQASQAYSNTKNGVMAVKPVNASPATRSQNASAADEAFKRKQVARAKQKYDHYIDLVDFYVKSANDLEARIAANNVMAYGGSERRELLDTKEKIKDYLDECVRWRQVAADNGGSISPSRIEAQARTLLSR